MVSCQHFSSLPNILFSLWLICYNLFNIQLFPPSHMLCAISLVILYITQVIFLKLHQPMLNMTTSQQVWFRPSFGSLMAQQCGEGESGILIVRNTTVASQRLKQNCHIQWDCMGCLVSHTQMIMIHNSYTCKSKLLL